MMKKEKRMLKDGDEREDKGNKEKIQKILEVLIVGTTKTEKKLLFGIEERSTRKLEEVGRIFEIAREKVRQIEAKALEKVRKHKVRKMV